MIPGIITKTQAHHVYHKKINNSFNSAIWQLIQFKNNMRRKINHKASKPNSHSFHKLHTVNFFGKFYQHNAV